MTDISGNTVALIRRSSDSKVDIARAHVDEEFVLEWCRQKGIVPVDVIHIVASLSPKWSRRQEADEWWGLLGYAVSTPDVQWIAVARYDRVMKHRMFPGWCRMNRVGVLVATPDATGNHVRYPIPEWD